MTTRILPRRAVVLPGRSPPSFRLTSADRVHFDVELATDPVLFNGALRTRRSPANFYTSAVEPRQPTYRRGIGDWTLDPAAWARLARADFLYYRAASFNGERGAPVSVELTIADAERVVCSVHPRLDLGRGTPDHAREPLGQAAVAAAGRQPHR